MQKQEFNKIIQATVTKVCQKQVINMESKVDHIVTGAICSLLGLEIGSHRVEIDHCNGRNSILIDIIRERAKDKVEKIVKGFKFDDKDTPSITAAFEKEFQKQLDYQIKWYAEQKAKEIASNLIDKYTERELTKLGFEPDKPKV